MYEDAMEEAEALRTLSAIAQATRLKVVTLLAGAGDAGMASSDIADAVGIPRNLMSSHLAVLSKASLVTTSRAGRLVTYRIASDALAKLGQYIEGLTNAPTRWTRSERPIRPDPPR